MSNDVALALQSWWQMPALPAADDDDDDDDDDDGLLRSWPGPGSEPSPLVPRAGGAGAAHSGHSGASSRKKKGR